MPSNVRHHQMFQRFPLARCFSYCFPSPLPHFLFPLPYPPLPAALSLSSSLLAALREFADNSLTIKWIKRCVQCGDTSRSASLLDPYLVPFSFFHFPSPSLLCLSPAPSLPLLSTSNRLHQQCIRDSARSAHVDVGRNLLLLESRRIHKHKLRQARRKSFPEFMLTITITVSGRITAVQWFRWSRGFQLTAPQKTFN